MHAACHAVVNKYVCACNTSLECSTKNSDNFMLNSYVRLVNTLLANFANYQLRRWTVRGRREC